MGTKLCLSMRYYYINARKAQEGYIETICNKLRGVSWKAGCSLITKSGHLFSHSFSISQSINSMKLMDLMGSSRDNSRKNNACFGCGIGKLQLKSLISEIDECVADVTAKSSSSTFSMLTLKVSGGCVFISHDDVGELISHDACSSASDPCGRSKTTMPKTHHSLNARIRSSCKAFKTSIISPHFYQIFFFLVS